MLLFFHFKNSIINGYFPRVVAKTAKRKPIFQVVHIKTIKENICLWKALKMCCEQKVACRNTCFPDLAVNLSTMSPTKFVGLCSPSSLVIWLQNTIKCT
jgi:hypothetical protein